jgi:hypothetical protein
MVKIVNHTAFLFTEHVKCQVTLLRSGTGGFGPEP